MPEVRDKMRAGWDPSLAPAGALRHWQRWCLWSGMFSQAHWCWSKHEQTFLMPITLARLSQVKRSFHIHVSKAHSNNRLHIQNWIIARARMLERNQEHSLPTQTNLSSGCQSDTLLFLSWEIIGGKAEPCRQPEGQGLSEAAEWGSTAG